MTYEQAIEKIHSLLTFGSRPGLDRMRIFLEKLGNPQDKLKYIHIAGTNGKGSVCAMLSNRSLRQEALTRVINIYENIYRESQS